MTIEVRRAVAQDAAELTRLRAEMFAALNGNPPRPASEQQWQLDAISLLGKQLADPGTEVAAFVVDDPDRAEQLAACAIGTIDQRLPGPHNASGRAGYVMSVSTDPSRRRRGYSRACMSALIEWFAAQGLTQISLNASTDGQPLYEQLGFAVSHGLSMRLRLPSAQ